MCKSLSSKVMAAGLTALLAGCGGVTEDEGLEYTGPLAVECVPDDPTVVLNSSDCPETLGYTMCLPSTSDPGRSYCSFRCTGARPSPEDELNSAVCAAYGGTCRREGDQGTFCAR